MLCLGEGIEKSIYDRGNRQNESRGIILSTTENKGGKILRDNSPGHHLITRDSIPMTFFQISHDYETQHLHQISIKNYLKAIIFSNTCSPIKGGIR